jgi:rod shape-determining protein MreC
MLLVVLAVAVVLVVLERRDATSGFGLLANGLFRASSAAESGAGRVLSTPTGWWSRLLDAGRLHGEVERLRADVDRLREENARLMGVMQENARLRGLVGYAAGHPRLELVPARVIAKDVTPFFRVQTLRLQVNHPRLAAGLPVVSSAGVVGYLTESSGPYAQVMLAVDPRSSIDVVVQRTRARGVVQGLGHANDYAARVAYLLRRDEVREGDILVTSGIGGRFPADLVVGRIAAVKSATQGIFQEVSVEPAVDFSRLEEVYIVLGEKEL